LLDYLGQRYEGNPNEISILGLAHVGDAVFELMVRTWLCMQGLTTAKRLHSETVAFVSARSQAAAAERLLPNLGEEEHAVYRRGRNAHVHSVPQSSTHEEYHIATGIEALFGYLYLKGENSRIGDLFKAMVTGGE
jgi:ribonuclease-3 family protein